MRFNPKYFQRFVLVGGTLVALSCAPGARAQQADTQATAQTQAQAQFQGQGQLHAADWTAFDQFLDAHPDIAAALQANPDLIYDQNFLGGHGDLKGFCDRHPNLRRDTDANRPQFRDWFRIRLQLRAMGQFLVSHPDIQKQLAANPALIDDHNFLESHPQLLDFLNNHADVRNAFHQDPRLFMNLEARFQGTEGYRVENNDDSRGMNPDSRRNPNPDLTQGEVASTDQFLDAHPDIEKQLEANPSLINNAKYLNDHPQLRDYLNNHAQVREEFTENPSYFMRRENQFEGSQGDVATMDAYLDKHRDEARDLNAYPARVNDSDYLAHHKDLEAFLKKHPDVREEFTHNPSAFMHQESTFDACAQMDDFLDSHKNVGKDLDQNPASVKDADYLDHHKDLKNFLAKNPGVSDQFQDNPSAFMDREKRFEADRKMDVYLSNHKNVSKDLQKNPDNVKDANYLDHHKDLKELMDKNPELAQAAQNDPSGFMQEQMKFHKDYRNQHIQQKTTVEERASTHGAQ